MDHQGETQVILLGAKLQSFLSRNPEIELRVGGSGYIVSRLWGEEAIELPLAHDDDQLFEVLNAVRLPPRFTAIWHEDKREFEVIFTVLNRNHHLVHRRFKFSYRGRQYDCSFEPSSSRLMAIARRARPSDKVWHTDYRNLQPYYQFAQSLKEHPDAEYVKNRRPTSFWIRGIVDYEDDRIEDLVRNLNFYMSYFDRRTPTILIHEETVPSHKFKSIHGPLIDSFPDTLSGADIDKHLLILWASAHTGDPFLRFIRYYQILEYAGYYHVRDQVRREVSWAITAPDALSRPEETITRIFDAISADRRSDNQKINSAILDCVEPQQIWGILKRAPDRFDKDVELDGGFVLVSLVGNARSCDEFAQSWKQFPEPFHKVRNALVHARERRQSTTIAPTAANRARLVPWLLPLSEMAAQVMIHGRL